MPDFTLKQNDRLPPITGTLEGASGAPVDLSSPNVTGVNFHMCTANDGTVIVNAPAQIVSATAGQVQYSWSATDTLLPGSYYGEWDVLYSDGKHERFPNSGNIIILIVKSVG